MARTQLTSRNNPDSCSSDSEDEATNGPKLSEEQAKKFKEIAEGSMRAELKHIDKKTTEQGNHYYVETVEEIVPEQVNWWSKFALCLVRQIVETRSGPVVNKTSLQINSQHLKDILKNTIKDYPGVSFSTKDITIDKPYQVLFHYRSELKDALKDLEGASEAFQHLDLLLVFINNEFKDVIEETENLLEQGMINYDNVWAIFRPGSIIYAPVFGQPRVFTLRSGQYLCDPPAFSLSVEYVDFDGDDMGTRRTDRLVSAFSGSEKISELSAYPIKWHPEQAEIIRQLISRGRRWEQHAGMHFCNYKGIALEYTGMGIARYSIDSRVVVDTKTYHRLNADFAFSTRAFKSAKDKQSSKRRIREDDEDDVETMDLIPEQKLELDPLTDEQRMLANSMVRGFSFSEKKWLDFFIDKLSPIAWNCECFDQLVLPTAQKDLVKALVATHVEHRLGFDDIVKGKGKGLILVLHGNPGVGKTLTAETVAEYCRRPLYMVSSGDLGTESETLDERLSRILDMASTWKAVLLIDEADVFLERRSLHDMQRNSLVSIFLRVLEYYEGILFLTSNRVNTFDDAFKSRIHVPLKYDDLTLDSRKQIWKNFLSKLSTDLADMNENDLDKLAQAELNGRQIKNVIRTAKSLAQFHGQKLDYEKLKQVVQIQREFEEELDLSKGANGVNGTSEVNGSLANRHAES